MMLKIEIVPITQSCHPKTVRRGLCCRKYIEHALDHSHFSNSGNNLFSTAEHVKVLNEGESRHRVVTFFFY